MSGFTEINEQFDISAWTYEGRKAVKVKAGRREGRRVVPPAGEDYAFDVVEWAREVEVYVSPTGRSVRVYVDGVEVAKQDHGLGVSDSENTQ